ncbi:MAG TPA: NUDIX hydrolase [Pseudonocardiaceae bacterium]|jgi:ADP-ribose pyrophosphatase|nr:NUDIX hydrolase [Pseudonocardiaceae bacterium]
MGDEQRHRFQVVSSVELYRGRVVALRADEVLMPGGTVARREVVEHYGAVAVVALDDAAETPETGPRVMLIHQYRHPLGRRLWELPAGLLDVPGEPPAATAARELAEEAGLAARQWDVLVDVAASPGFTDEVVRVFLARGLSAIGREVPDGDEETDLVARWFDFAEAVRMVLAGEIVNAATVAGILAAEAVRSGVAAVTRSADAPWPDRPSRFAAGM